MYNHGQYFDIINYSCKMSIGVSNQCLFFRCQLNQKCNIIKVLTILLVLNLLFTFYLAYAHLSFSMEVNMLLKNQFSIFNRSEKNTQKDTLLSKVNKLEQKIIELTNKNILLQSQIQQLTQLITPPITIRIQHQQFTKQNQEFQQNKSSQGQNQEEQKSQQQQQSNWWKNTYQQTSSKFKDFSDHISENINVENLSENAKFIYERSSENIEFVRSKAIQGANVLIDNLQEGKNKASQFFSSLFL